MLLSEPDISSEVIMKGQTPEVPKNGFHTKVVGNTFNGRQDAIDASLLDAGVLLYWEKGNDHDKFAIAVLRADDGRQIGYIAGCYTPFLAPHAKFMELCAKVLEVTGGVGDKPNKGVNLFVYREDEEPLPSKGFMQIHCGDYRD